MRCQTAEIVRVANGWIVYPNGRYQMNRDMQTPMKDVYVFGSWEDCEQFLFSITEEAHD